MCLGKKGSKKFSRRLDGREDPVDIQGSVSPFPVGIELVAGPVGSPDQQGFQLRGVKDPGRQLLHSPFHQKGAGTGADSCCYRSSCPDLEPPAGGRSRYIDAGRGKVRLDIAGPGIAPAGIEKEAVIIGVVGSRSNGVYRGPGWVPGNGYPAGKIQ